MKIIDKAIKILILSLIIVNIFGIIDNCYAAKDGTADPLDPDRLTSTDLDPYKDMEDGGMVTMAKKVLVVIRGVSVVLTVILIAVIGFEFILASSAEQRAEILQKSGGILIGVIMLTAGVSIVTLIVTNLV